MAKYRMWDVREQVYGLLIAKLTDESMCDDDDEEFIDKAMKVQQRLAKRLGKEMAKWKRR